LRPGDQRALNDPKFTIKLPEVAEDEEKRVVLDLFAWESDHSTDETKKLFTNDSAAKLMEIYKKANQNKKKTREDFLNWAKNGDNEVLAALIAAGVMAASTVVPYVAIAKAAIKLLNYGIEAIKMNADDYLGFARAEVIYSRKNGRLLYRWIFNNGAESWQKKEKPVIYQDWRILEANRGNELDTRFHIQIVGSNPQDFKEPEPD